MSTAERDEARRRARAALAAMTAEESAAINAAAESDPDALPLTDAQLAAMRPAEEVVPDIIKRARGQRGPGRRPAKVQVALRLDPDVVAKWRATGTGWQTRMGEVLKRVVDG